MKIKKFERKTRTERTWRNRVLTIMLILSIGFAGMGSGYAMVQFYKTVAGVASVDYNDQIAVTDVLVQSTSKVRVTVKATATTVASQVYTTHLYDQGGEIGTPQTATWTAAQVTALTSFNETFTGLATGGITNLGVEVR